MTVQLVWGWAGENWKDLVLLWIRHGIRWRELSGAEMTWLLYDHFVACLPDARKRQFFTQAEDWPALREFDNSGFDEGGA